MRRPDGRKSRNYSTTAVKLYKVKGIIYVELQLVTENVLVNRFPCQYFVYFEILFSHI